MLGLAQVYNISANCFNSGDTWIINKRLSEISESVKGVFV